MVLAMKHFKEKPQTFVCVRVPELEDIKGAYEVLEWVLHNAADEVWMVDYNKEDGAIYIYSKLSNMVANPGDCIVKDPFGGFQTYTLEKFSKMYTPIKWKA